MPVGHTAYGLRQGRDGQARRGPNWEDVRLSKDHPGTGTSGSLREVAIWRVGPSGRCTFESYAVLADWSKVSSGESGAREGRQ